MIKSSEFQEQTDQGSFKKLQWLATKEPFLIFDITFYEQLDAVDLGSPFGPTLPNSFLCYHDKRLKSAQRNSNQCFIGGICTIFVFFFRKEGHLKLFLNYFNS